MDGVEGGDGLEAPVRPPAGLRLGGTPLGQLDALAGDPLGERRTGGRQRAREEEQREQDAKTAPSANSRPKNAFRWPFDRLRVSGVLAIQRL
jgi:hypothetical protein